MGDRVNVHFKFENERQTVNLYSHWGGSSIHNALAAALGSKNARNRWPDPAYLCRILIEGIIGDEHGTETGFGISPGEYVILAENPAILVDLHNQKVLVPGRDPLSYQEFIDWATEHMHESWDALTGDGDDDY